jgi:hypothetical protein
MNRNVVISCAAALTVTLAACGSSKNVDTAPTLPQTSTTNTAAPVVTSTLLTLPPTVPVTTAPATIATVPATVAIATVPSQTQPPSTRPPTTTAAPTTAEPTTEAPTTAAATTEAPTTSAPTTAPTTTEAAGSSYTEVSPPNAPSVTAAVDAGGRHPDGVYYATVTEGGDTSAGTVSFELVQLFRGDKCTEHFGPDNEDACLNDFGVETNPTAMITVDLDGPYISVVDAETQKSYKIDGAELYALIHGDDPSNGAPDGYTYVGFGYFLTISGGQVTRLEQWWTP